MLLYNIEVSIHIATIQRAGITGLVLLSERPTPSPPPPPYVPLQYIISKIHILTRPQRQGIHVLHYNTVLVLGRILYTELLSTGQNYIVKHMVKYF